MQTTTKIAIGVGVVGAGFGGFVAFRRFVRSEARKALIEQYRFDKAFNGLELLEKASGKNWNLPTFEEFLAAITPTWSLTMPDAAIDDVILKGRESQFWPEQYRQPADKTAEAFIFTALRGASEAETDLISDIIGSASSAITQMIAQSGKK
jgi:hypothetical protein